MKKRNRYRWLWIVSMVLIASGSHAQGVFTWRAPIDTIRKDGFYQILLTPEMVSKCSKADLADVRILGPGNRFVSYVLKDSHGSVDSGKDRLAIPGIVMAQKDSSNKHSYVELRFPGAYEIDQINFVIRDPVFYKREAQIFAEGANANEWTSLTAITLAPGGGPLSIPSVKTARLRIDITNADNAPLVVNEVAAFQRSRYLLAYLKAGTGYQVLAGDPQASAPEYDLKYFTDSLTAMPPTLAPGPLQKASFANDLPARPAAKVAAGEHSGGLLLWGILLAILILLVYFSVKMVKAITQKEPHDRV